MRKEIGFKLFVKQNRKQSVIRCRPIHILFIFFRTQRLQTKSYFGPTMRYIYDNAQSRLLLSSNRAITNVLKYSFDIGGATV
jgi:hypothetical protein